MRNRNRERERVEIGYRQKWLVRIDNRLYLSAWLKLCFLFFLNSFLLWRRWKMKREIGKKKIRTSSLADGSKVSKKVSLYSLLALWFRRFFLSFHQKKMSLLFPLSLFSFRVFFFGLVLCLFFLLVTLRDWESLRDTIAMFVQKDLMSS